MIVDTVRFHAIGESLPVLTAESGAIGNPRTPVDPKSEVVININAKPEIMNIRTNFVLEMCIKLLGSDYMYHKSENN